MEVKINLENRQPERTRAIFRLTQLFVAGLFKLFIGLKIEGAENVPRSGAFYLASNHQSWFDPPIVGSTCPRELFFAAKLELFKTPVLGFLVKYYNSLPVRRDGFDRALLKSAGEVIKAGYGLILFPEGTRYLDGNLHTPRAGIWNACF